MMFKKTFTCLFIFMVGVMLVFSPTIGSAAPEATSLKDIRKTFFERKEKLLFDYLENLVKLETRIVTSNNPQDAAEVKAEIGRIERELKKIPKAVPNPTSIQPPTAITAQKAAPRPVIKKRDPKTHVSKVEGLAGASNFSKNNIYTFYLADIGKVSTLKFWATGRRSVDSVGYVWLINPDGRRERVTKWKERYFEKPSTEISSYKEIEPFVEDISELVTKAGNYKIEFEWTGGIDPLVIYRVELIS